MNPDNTNNSRASLTLLKPTIKDLNLRLLLGLPTDKDLSPGQVIMISEQLFLKRVRKPGGIFVITDKDLREIVESTEAVFNGGGF